MSDSIFSQASSSAHLKYHNAKKEIEFRFQEEAVSVSDVCLPHLRRVVPGGELISAVLKTSINSEQPGKVHAMTTRDVYSLEEGDLLIPKGANLFGEFNTDFIEGQIMLSIVWNKLQMSNGVVVQLNNPNSEVLGRRGQKTFILNSHFRDVALISLIRSHELDDQDSNIKPTLQINQDICINVIVAYDLDFSRMGLSNSLVMSADLVGKS